MQMSGLSLSCYLWHISVLLFAYDDFVASHAVLGSKQTDRQAGSSNLASAHETRSMSAQRPLWGMSLFGCMRSSQLPCPSLMSAHCWHSTIACMWGVVLVLSAHPKHSVTSPAVNNEGRKHCSWKVAPCEMAISDGDKGLAGARRKQP